MGNNRRLDDAYRIFKQHGFVGDRDQFDAMFQRAFEATRLFTSDEIRVFLQAIGVGAFLLAGLWLLGPEPCSMI